MKQYVQLVEDVLAHGKQTMDRTGTGTLSLKGCTMRFNLTDGFPLLNLKRTPLGPIKEELLWFLRGETNKNTLNAKIWDQWSAPDGELGRIYGAQWRSWRRGDGVEVDQIKKVIQSLQNNPYDRGHIVSAWNVGELHLMALRPCHALFQFHVEPLSPQERYAIYKKKAMRAGHCVRMMGTYDTEGGLTFTEEELSYLALYVPDKGLSCQLYQRSADIGLGVPFNIASYALLAMMVAQVLGMEPVEFIWMGGDCHIYLNHVKGLKDCITRQEYALPDLMLNPFVKDIDQFKSEDIWLSGSTTQHAHIKLEVSV